MENMPLLQVLIEYLTQCCQHRAPACTSVSTRHAAQTLTENYAALVLIKNLDTSSISRKCRVNFTYLLLYSISTLADVFPIGLIGQEKRKSK